MVSASLPLSSPLSLLTLLSVLQVPLDPRSGLSMLLEDLLSFVLGLAALLVLGYVAYQAWQPVAAYVRHDGE